MQYRYQRKWIADSVLEKISRKQVQGTKCLLTYIDQSTPSQPMGFVPLRTAIMTSAQPHGTTVSFLMRLEKFVYAEDLSGFKGEITGASGSLLPKWGSDASPVGKYVLEISEKLNSIAENTDADWSQLVLTTWEKLVGQLHDRRDFQPLNFFYKVLGLFPVGADVPLSLLPVEGEKLVSYEIVAGQEYELRLYQYHPEKSPTNEGLIFRATEGAIDFLTNPTIIVDSKYDLKRLRLTVDPSGLLNAISVAVHRVSDVGKEEFGRWEFDILFRVRQPKGWKIGVGMGVGLLLAAPQIISAWLSPSLPDLSRWIVSGIAVASGITVGLFVMFRIKRPI